MELWELERAASIVYEMCRQHPEICPHDWEYHFSRPIDAEGKVKEVHYKCCICGIEETRTERSEKND